MRLFCTLMLVGSGCAFGDDSPGAEPPSTSRPDMDDMGEVGEADPVVPLISEVCDQRTWELTPDTKNLDVSVVATAAGATVFGVPKDGGAVRAFRIDQRGDLFDREMVAIREDRNYTGVSASTAAGRLVVASQVGDKVSLDIIRDDLGARFALGDFSGTVVTPMLTARATQVAVTGGADGVVANGFTGASWEATPAVQLTKSPIVSMTATALLDDVMLAWSTTNKECHVRRFAAAKESTREFGCDNARIAVHSSGKNGMLVFEEAGAVYRSDLMIGGESEIANKVRLAEIGTSPRVVFDGSVYWISYVDLHGVVIVGFIDKDGRFNSRALDTQPAVADAYDLAVYGEGVWVVGLSEDVFDAQRICAVPLQ